MSTLDKLYIFTSLILIGTAISLVSRNSAKVKKDWKGTVLTLITDYTFEYYVTISTLSLVYAILQGGLIGLSLAWVFLAFFEGDLIFIAYSIASLSLIFFARLIIEGYMVFYKTARDASTFFALSSKNMLAADASMHERNRESFNSSAKLGRPSKASDEQIRHIDRVILLLEKNGIDVTNFSYELSHVDSHSATIVRQDGSLISELFFDPVDSTAYVYLEDGERARLIY